jgi:hypothetical protein
MYTTNLVLYIRLIFIIYISILVLLDLIKVMKFAQENVILLYLGQTKHGPLWN